MPEFKGRPGSAGQRPTGGDKAVATQKKAYFRRKKVCRFCVEKIDDINYKDTKLLHAFVAERGKIVPRRISGLRPAPAAADRRHQEGAQHRPAAVRGGVLVAEPWKSYCAKISNEWEPAAR